MVIRRIQELQSSNALTNSDENTENIHSIMSREDLQKKVLELTSELAQKEKTINELKSQIAKQVQFYNSFLL